MYTFPELIKKIRNEAGLTQPDFANRIGVSSALIAMIETGQKEVSKKFISKLAKALNVHPVSLTPFMYFDEVNPDNLSGFERKIIDQGTVWQKKLIEQKAHFLNQ